MLGIDINPLIASGLAGFLWPLIQAAFDRPEWTATRRRWLVVAAGVVLSVLVWFVGSHPAAWDALATQAGVIIGVASTVFTVLKQAGVIDWVGRVTPGGEPAHTPEHAAETGE